MKIKCDICKKMLKEPGALLFSPPTSYPKYNIIDNGVIKYHICILCWHKMYPIILNFDRITSYKILR